jgi:hypothetical protein
MNIFHKHEEKDYYKAHQYCSQHRDQLLKSDLCGCFYCKHIFSPSEILDWVDEDKDGIGQTALCPHCGIDSVIGSKAGFPISFVFLETMHKYWF